MWQCCQLWNATQATFCERTKPALLYIKETSRLGSVKISVAANNTCITSWVFTPEVKRKHPQCQVFHRISSRQPTHGPVRQ